PTSMQMKTTGDMDGMAISAKIEGIGDEISDFLDETILFASYATSKSNPDGLGGQTVMNMEMASMMGSTDSETGYSYWIGAQMPNMTGGKFGLEYNHGSKYWRPFTYGEDTLAGSKMAVRGDAYEAYWTQPLVGKAFSMQVRYTYMDYDYTGSDGFFGDGGTPMSMSEVKQLNQFLTSIGQENMDTVETAQDIRVYFRYKY
ncbi:MAG: DUF3373 family protein, partial [Campylobacterota bacterium]|nr:DUF3373 family protein [Campylobacterota bacterium]